MQGNTVTVSGNQVNNGGNGAGIQADAITGETTIINAFNNALTNTDKGFLLNATGTGVVNSTINNNSITGSTDSAIDNQGITNSNATCNWYGTTDPVIIASKINGPVTYIPYLQNGTDAQPATPGFQPVPGTCFVRTRYYVNDNSTVGDGYTTAIGNDATGTGSPSAPFATVQKAISTASSGDSIYIDAGTYFEDVMVTKGLHITGLTQPLTIIYPGSSNPVGTGGTFGGNNIFLIRESNVTIRDLTADGDNPANGAGVDARNGIVTDFNSGDYTNLVVHHNTIRNIYWRGIYSAYGSTPGNTFNFHHNTVTNVQGDPNASIGIFNFGNSGSIDNNTVTNTSDAISANQSTGTTFTNNTVTGSGIHTDNNGGSGGTADLIQGNNISNIATGGFGILVFLPSLNVIVEENTINNADIGIGNIGQEVSATPVFRRNTIDGQNRPNSTGIYQSTSYPGFLSSNVSGSYLNNFIKNNQQGFYFKHELGYASTTQAHENSITGNTTSIVRAIGPDGAGAFVNDFSCNWYGSPAPTVSGGSINYQPTLINGTDNQPATPGFQPIPGSCTNCITPDAVAPSITLKSNPKVFLDATGHYTVQLSDVLQSVTDNCDPNPGASVNTVNLTCTNLGSGGTPSAHQAYISNTNAGNSSFKGELGLVFSVNDPNGIIVNKLSAFDHQGNGISGTQAGGVRVAIFNISTQSIVPGLDVTITGATDPLVDNYRVRNISPVNFAAGNYALVAKGYDIPELFFNRGLSGPLNAAGDGASGAVSFSNTVYWGNDVAVGYGFPVNTGNAGNPNEYIAGTFTYSLNVSNSVTVTAIDASGNQSQAIALVAVEDTFYTLTTKDISINLNGSGAASIQPSYVFLSLKNNCGADVTGSTFQVSPANFACSDVGGSTSVSPISHSAYISNTSAGNSSYLGELGLVFR